jgi:alkylation response protein AidB-like acyl-CoA dehydrogenase
MIAELTDEQNAMREMALELARTFNCNSPDSGNMEIVQLCATPDQRERWLNPLLDGAIRSCFSMTEPATASSDATNLETAIARDGDSCRVRGLDSHGPHPFGRGVRDA